MGEQARADGELEELRWWLEFLLSTTEEEIGMIGWEYVETHIDMIDGNALGLTAMPVEI